MRKNTKKMNHSSADASTTRRAIFADYWKSPRLRAGLVTAVVFSAFIAISLSCVVMTAVIKGDDPQFETKIAARPRKQLLKLRPPINATRQQPKVKPLQRVVAINLDRKMPEMQIPELSGIKGGTGTIGGGGGRILVGKGGADQCIALPSADVAV